ncbi:uncharacterized protein LOC134831606 [Culicoides brevitarsis]|uniref:uncharacterized protein LOC134831606 n=1 Tax=Culicoides brevitarsis TaxID=469753 RepID=UPI00307B644C
MFRLVVLSAFIAVAAAAPSVTHHGLATHSVSHGAVVVDTYQPSVLKKTVIQEPVLKSYEKTVVKPELTVVEEPTVHHVGNVVKSFPTAVSHQSQTIVHSKADVVEPIYQHGLKKTVIETPRIEKHVVHQPEIHTKTLVEASPAVHTSYVASAPAVHTYSAPLTKTLVAAPLTKTLVHEAPLTYSHGVYSHGLPLTYAHSAPAVHAW